jgi:hypothetical protein
MSNRELWIYNFKLLEEYINIHKELPSDYSKDPNTQKIARWKMTQKNNFKNASHIMKEDENIKNMWEQFVKKHSELFRTNEEKWFDYLKELEEYIQINKKLPSHTNKDKNISSLASWVLPTPVGPKKMKEPIGLFGSLSPILFLSIAFAIFSTASF